MSILKSNAKARVRDKIARNIRAATIRVRRGAFARFRAGGRAALLDAARRSG